MAKQGNTRELVAIILAIGLVTSFVTLSLAVLWVSVTKEPSRLSENATQILSAVFGGMIGILGSYLGYRSISSSHKTKDQEEGRLNDPQGETPSDDGRGP
jgi:amino acid transporter